MRTPVLRIQCCLLLLAFSDLNVLRSNSIEIPSIPADHLRCWKRNLPSKIRERLIKFCREKQSDEIIANDSSTANTQEINRVICDDSPEPCWGYESDANQDCLLYRSECSESAQSWVPNKVEQLKTFFKTADFGYVRDRRTELQYYCQQNVNASAPRSELRCTDYLRYCVGKNIFINLRRVGQLEEPIRYREDVLEYGDIGGWNCTLDRTRLRQQGEHKSPLMSWFAEISNFKSIEEEHRNNDSSSQFCDVILRKPTFIMKLDATVNMYHHFCDFVNLYISLHVNGSHFDRDNHILIWDSYPYRSNFAPIFTAFTRNPILNLQDFRQKRICFQDVMFPLLPRMIFGLYYNMPLIPGCTGSGLMRSFNRHVLHHLGMRTSEALQIDDTIRITFISRRTQYRRVLNEDELISALEQSPLFSQTNNIAIRRADFNHRVPFREQIEITSQTDILIGIHGAGLTHTLLQPDYGALFELYNCEDADCYRDLARLRGTHYVTWRNSSRLQPIESDDSQAADRQRLGRAHAKFVNYRFDAHEFVRIVTETIEIVRKRKAAFRDELMQRKSRWPSKSTLKEKVEL